MKCTEIDKDLGVSSAPHRDIDLLIIFIWPGRALQLRHKTMPTHEHKHLYTRLGVLFVFMFGLALPFVATKKCQHTLRIRIKWPRMRYKQTDSGREKTKAKMGETKGAEAQTFGAIKVCTSSCIKHGP